MLLLFHFLASTLAYSPTSDFSYYTDWAFPLKVAFFDFDKTLTATSIGESVITDCDPQCLNYSAPSCLCSGPHALAQFLVDMPNNTEFAQGPAGFDGEDRITRMKQMFNSLKDQGVELRVLSTSWGLIKGAEWAAFILEFLKLGGFDGVFKLEQIIALDDPGEGVVGNKGQAAAEFLASQGWEQHNGMLLDDSHKNIDTCAGKVDWLWVVPAKGFARDVMEFMEKRAGGIKFTAGSVAGIAIGVGLSVAVIFIACVHCRARASAKVDDAHLIRGSSTRPSRVRVMSRRIAITFAVCLCVTVAVGLGLGLTQKMCCR